MSVVLESLKETGLQHYSNKDLSEYVVQHFSRDKTLDEVFITT